MRLDHRPAAENYRERDVVLLYQPRREKKELSQNYKNPGKDHTQPHIRVFAN